MNVPEELLKQFRTVALERIQRIETGWSSVLKHLDDQSGESIHRELHTLKGESKMLGFSDVNLVAHKLEDLLEVARARGYAVDEDFDLIVNMALRFMAMLVRKKIGAQLGGIDLPGFIKQIDGLLAEVRPEGSRRTSGAMQPLRPTPVRATRIPNALRAKLEPIAVDCFVEYATARRQRRDRLRGSWHALRELVGVHRAMIGPAQLAKHRHGAQVLARELGKQVDVTFDIASSEVTTEILAALDGAVLHLVRNALDHGIETPAERAAAGKPEHAAIRVRCHPQPDKLVLTVEDDGRGIGFDAVRARAIELGLVDAHVASVEDRWIDLVCTPGFSTLAKAGDISGRGVGLDAVRASLNEISASLDATTTPGRGTRWTVEAPLQRITFEARMLRVPGLPFPIALDLAWQPSETAPEATRVIDLAHILGLSEAPVHDGIRYFARGEQVLGIAIEREGGASMVRRVVTPAAPAPLEVVLFETVEGLFLRPELLL